LKNDGDNWAPRLGFSWDTRKDGHHILRGGIGRFYDFPYTNATILFPAAAVQSNYGVVYNVTNGAGIRNADGSLYHVGQPLPPNGLPGADIPPPNEVASPGIRTPYSDQISLGYSWQATDWLGLNFEGITIKYEDIPYRMRGNPTLDANGNHQSTRRFSDFGNFRVWQGDGHASYDGFNAGFRVRQPKFELQGFYTWSRAKGNILAGADEFRIWDANAQSDVLARDASVSPTDPDCGKCNGPLYTDATHRLTLGGTWHAVWGIDVSGFLRYRSGLPYTKYNAGVLDLNGDSFRNDLAPGVSNVNSGRGDSFSQFDLRVAKEFVVGDFGIGVIFEAFNLFDSENPAGFNSAGQASKFAGDPLQGEQQLIQLGLRLRWK
jgi:hypothetical protein